MQAATLICNNFSGINRSTSSYSSGVITASDIQNVELFSTEINSGVGIRTVNGNVSVCELVPINENVVDIYESIQKSKSNFFVYAESESEGKIYLFDPQTGGLTEKVKGLTVTGKSCATDVSQGWSDLWVFSNGEEILSIELGKTDEEGNQDEVKMMELTDMEERTVKGLGLAVYAGRLWIFSNRILWYSVQENIYDFSTSDAEIATSAGYIEFVKNITAIYPYLGYLAVFHSNSSCMIAQDEDDMSFYKTFDSPGGCAGAKSLVFHGTQLYFYDDTKKGVFCFLQVMNGDKTLGDNIALDIQSELFSVPKGKIGDIKMLSVVTSDRNEVWFLLPTEDSHSIIMIYDYLHGAWVKRKSQKISSMAIVDSKLYSAGKKIYEEYKSSGFDGEFIESYYKCTPFNMGTENSVKILAYPPKITLNKYYSNDFYVEYIRDYDSLTKKVRHIVSKSLKHVLFYDTGYWDKEYYPRAKVSIIKKLPASFFKTLQISFMASDEGQGFCISNIEYGKIKVKL